MDTFKKHAKLLIFSVLCCIPFFGWTSINETKLSKYVDEVLADYSKEMKNKYGLSYAGSGGQMRDKVRTFHVYFQSSKVENIDQARTLEVLASERLCEIINAHKNLRNYLHEYPFPIDKTEVMISLRLKSSDVIRDGPDTVFHTNGQIYYAYDDPSSGLLEDKYQEPYDEAYKIVMGRSR